MSWVSTIWKKLSRMIMRLHQCVQPGLRSPGVLTGAGGPKSKITDSHGCGQEANRSQMSRCPWLPEWHLPSCKWVVQEKKTRQKPHIFNNLALKVTSYHSAIFYWSHRIIRIHCGKGLYKGTDSRMGMKGVILLANYHMSRDQPSSKEK